MWVKARDATKKDSTGFTKVPVTREALKKRQGKHCKETAKKAHTKIPVGREATKKTARAEPTKKKQGSTIKAKREASKKDSNNE
jgi:hypothetical protein